MKIAFVCPRLHEPGTVGGAETLIYSLAADAVSLGHEVEFLTTCARNHFTWENELPEGAFSRGGMTVRRFPVNTERNSEIFLSLQSLICSGRSLSDEDERLWMRNSVNSDALVSYLHSIESEIDRVVAGPYLFGLVESVANNFPEKTILIPCLHDEPFARVRIIARMFTQVRGFMFNTDPERELAYRLYPDMRPVVDDVVAMGIEPFEVSKTAFKEHYGLTGDYIMYSGRREPLKGTPVLVDYLDCFRKRTGRDVKLVLTGSGAVEVPQALSGAVVDLGFVPETEKREAMAGAVAFCHPSINESLGIVLLESWLARTPVLVHARGEVLRRQCMASNGGLWFSRYPEFEEELVFLQDNPDAASLLAEQGRRYTIDMYSPAKVKQRFDAALRKGRVQ